MEEREPVPEPNIVYDNSSDLGNFLSMYKFVMMAFVFML